MRNVNVNDDPNKRCSTNVIPGGIGGIGGLGSPKAGLLAAIQSSGKLKQVDEDIVNATPQPSSTDKTKEPSNIENEKSTNNDQNGTVKTVVSKNSALESTKDTDIDIAEDTRKCSEDITTKETDCVISSYGHVSQQTQTYKRKASAGQPVNKTTLLSCPPPKRVENHLKNVAEENARKQEEADMLKKEAMEKARAEAKERAERLRREKEERELKEKREREEAEQKERERQELLESSERKKRLSADWQERQRKRGWNKKRGNKKKNMIVFKMTKLLSWNRESRSVKRKLNNSKK